MIVTNADELAELLGTTEEEATEEEATEDEADSIEYLPIVIAVQTSSYGNEFTWEITSSDEVVCSGGPYDSHAVYAVEDCDLENGSYTLKCIDSFGDGWHGGHVTIEGHQYCGDFNKTNGEQPGVLMTAEFDIVRTFPLDIVVETMSYGNEFAWEIVSSDLIEYDVATEEFVPAVVCSGGPYDSNSIYDQVGCVISDGDYTLKCIDSYGDGWHGGSVTIRGHQYCQDFTKDTGEDPGTLMTADFHVSTAPNADVPADAPFLSMSLSILSYGSEISWEIATLDDTVVCSGGGGNYITTYASNTDYEVTDCQIEGGDYVLNCIDSYGDGWNGATATINGVAYCADFTSGAGEDPGRLMTAAITV